MVAAHHCDHPESHTGGEHLDERERDRVVARRVALHQHDLQGVDRGAGEHEQVARGRAGVDAREEREAARRERDPRPRGGRDPRAKQHEGSG